MGELPKAVGLIRTDVFGKGADVHRVAERYGYRLVWTVRLDVGPLASALIVAGIVVEHAAVAVVVPSLEHVVSIRHAITDLAALATPMQFYPRGHRWPAVDQGESGPSEADRDGTR